MARKKKETTPETAQEKFKKEQLLKSKLFEENKDILNVVLDEDIEYTVEATAEKIRLFMKEEVK